jgi:hypothetical protein
MCFIVGFVGGGGDGGKRFKEIGPKKQKRSGVSKGWA